MHIKKNQQRGEEGVQATEQPKEAAARQSL